MNHYLFSETKLSFEKGFDYDNEIIQSNLSSHSVRFNYSRICEIVETRFEENLYAAKKLT